MTAKIPTIILNDGYLIPVVGLGTWQGPPGKEAEVGDAIRTAIDLGYRHFDCAHAYLNEYIIGEALADKIKEGVVKREDLFIVSKLWNIDHHRDHVEPALRRTLKNLRLDYLDLYIIHWPHAFKHGEEIYPTDPATGLIILDLETDYLDTWKAMEKVHKKGLTRSIGVSNFTSQQLERVIKNSNTVPVVNQIECHPYLNQEKLRQFCAKRGIAIVGYSPLGSPERPWQVPGEPDLISDQKIKKIAETYGKTSAQVLLRYQIHLGNATIPKSSNSARLKQNIEIFDFELSSDDLAYLNTFNRKDGRICPNAEAKFHPDYPFQPHIEF